MAMILGTNDIESYRDNLPPNGRSAEIVEFAKKIRFLNNEMNVEGACIQKISIRLKNGLAHNADTNWARGDCLHNPMTWAELEHKFRVQAQLGGISETQQDRIIDIVRNLEEQDDVIALISNLVRREVQ